ncbi:MAG TPA: hypothetical protein VGK31_02025, partial [Thermoanaerobaculia bacterium]
MFDKSGVRLLLITDDEFFAEVIGTYMQRDHIAIDRVSSVGEAGREIAVGADGVLVDLAKRA